MTFRRALASFAVIGCAALGTYSMAQQAEQASAAKLRNFYAAEWEYALEHHPELATYVGDERFNDRLSDYSVEENAREAKHTEQQLAALRAIPAEGLSDEERTSRQMAIEQMELSLEGYRLGEWEMPVNQMNGPHLEFASMYSQMPFASAKDYANYVARVRGIPKALDQITGVLRRGMRDHRMPPRYLLVKVGDESQDIADKRGYNSPFAAPLKQLSHIVSAADAARIQPGLVAAIDDEVGPAYARFAKFVKEDYAPKGRKDPGIWALPDGDALYRHDIREHVQTKQSPDQIFEEGISQVKQIDGEMLALARAQGFADLKSFNEHIRTDKSHYAHSAQQLLGLYAGYEKQMQAKLPELVETVPALKLEVVPMDSFRAPSAVPADYSPGSAAGNRPGRVNVNLYRPEQRSLLNIEAIAYHEGVPGHHLQFSFAEQLTDLPPFRRFGSYDAYSEGWALYAEQLGKEVGFYQDPYSEYGRLQNEMWRSVRLVVDTGVHAKHWTRDQMIEFFQAHTAMDDATIHTEVDRYIAWPGQALAYRLGQMKILELRARAKERLGTRYDIKAFHQVVLGMGPVPLDVMEDGVERWLGTRN